MLELGRAGQSVELVPGIHWGQGLGVQQVELELRADRRPVSHRFGARDLCLQRTARVDRDGLVIGAERPPEAEGAALLPGHCVHCAAREDVHVRVAVVHVDVGRIPHVAGHVAGEHRDRECVVGRADPRPLLGGDPLASQEAVQIADAQRDGVGSFRQRVHVFRHRSGLPCSSTGRCSAISSPVSGCVNGVRRSGSDSDRGRACRRTSRLRAGDPRVRRLRRPDGSTPSASCRRKRALSGGSAPGVDIGRPLTYM